MDQLKRQWVLSSLSSLSFSSLYGGSQRGSWDFRPLKKICSFLTMKETLKDWSTPVFWEPITLSGQALTLPHWRWKQFSRMVTPGSGKGTLLENSKELPQIQLFCSESRAGRLSSLKLHLGHSVRVHSCPFRAVTRIDKLMKEAWLRAKYKAGSLHFWIQELTTEPASEASYTTVQYMLRRMSSDM